MVQLSRSVRIRTGACGSSSRIAVLAVYLTVFPLNSEHFSHGTRFASHILPMLRHEAGWRGDMSSRGSLVRDGP
jgi:hypothetical protein